ncbi:hypothetical protein HY605_02540 [Candidatus Peregrinibacteria bacterium]|nr:hypothetical protein [Candidatus Peregrinibacteria bacterium]
MEGVERDPDSASTALRNFAIIDSQDPLVVAAENGADTAEEAHAEPDQILLAMEEAIRQARNDQLRGN